MVSLPWYLLAVGIGFVVVGSLLAGLPQSAGRGREAIHPRMRDGEIVRDLNRGERISFPSLVILAGFTCILVSICWRVARIFL